MTGSDSNGANIALFLKASNDTTSLGELAGGSSDNFAKVGLISTADINKEATITKRNANNSKIPIKTFVQGEDNSMTVNALIGTNVVKSCQKGYIADYLGSATTDIPDDEKGFEAEAIFLFLDEDESWDEVASLAHNGGEYWKSVKVVGSGTRSFAEDGGTLTYPFEIHLGRDTSGSSIRDISPDNASGIDVTEEYVDMSSIIA
jgi:hypothetical protein